MFMSNTLMTLKDVRLDDETRRKILSGEIGWESPKPASLRAAVVTHVCHCYGTPDPLAPSAAKPQPQPKAGDKVVLLRSRTWVDSLYGWITMPAGTILDVVSLPDDRDPSLYVDLVPFRCDVARDGWLVVSSRHIKLCLVELAESATHDCHCPDVILFSQGCQCGGR